MRSYGGRMGEFTSCRVCHFSARAWIATGPVFHDSEPSLARRRCVSEGVEREKSRQ
jgi:hypothetical protein